MLILFSLVILGDDRVLTGYPEMELELAYWRRPFPSRGTRPVILRSIDRYTDSAAVSDSPHRHHQVKRGKPHVCVQTDEYRQHTENHGCASSVVAWDACSHRTRSTRSFTAYTAPTAQTTPSASQPNAISTPQAPANINGTVRRMG